MSDYSEIDLAIAIQLQAQFEEERRVHLLNNEKLSSNAADLKKMLTKDGKIYEPEQEKLSVSLIDPTWELLDPNPKIHDLFLIFNDQFFWGRLSGIAVSWSPRMTLCAGVCSYERRGGLCSVRLSVPLLKLRPRKDLVETLLHEMIHAYLFVTKNDTDHDGHGPQFHNHMYRINKIAGTKISVYHQFHDEVDVYRQHIWLCNGPCQKRRPYFGLVKRSMNRAPSERDPWWQQHKLSCGGTYTKIKEPEGCGIKSKRIKTSEGAALNSKPVEDIRKFFAPSHDAKSSSSNKENFKKFPGGNINKLDLSTKDGTKVVKKTGNIHGIDEGRNLKGKNSAAKKPAVSQKFNTRNPVGESAKKEVKRGGQSNLGIKAGSRSTTVTVGKWRPSTETKPPPANLAPVSNFTPFGGQGHSLGGAEPTVKVSRLLSLQSRGNQIASSTHKLPSCNSVISPQSSIPVDKFTMHHLNSEENLPSTSKVKCPLCRKELNSADFDDHISICLGDFDESDDDFISKQSRKTSCSKISGNEINIISSSPNRESISNDDEVSADVIASELQDSVIIVDDFDSNSFLCTSQSEGKLFPCPVCNESFSESRISKHVNEHFS